MARGYWIVSADIHDVEQYRAYVRANAEPLRRHGARFLVRGGAFENPEGSARSRHVVIEFPSYQAALDCWHSPEYQAALAIRAPVADLDLVIIEGYEDSPGETPTG